MNKVLTFFCICLFLSLNACSTQNLSDTKQAADLPELRCIAVLPVTTPVTSTAEVSQDRAKTLEQGALFLDSVLIEKLGSRDEFKVLSENQLDAILSNPWAGRSHQAADIGRVTGCGGILETTISRYRHRVGGEMSIETSAAAAFSMELVGIEQGVVLWSTSFDEIQKALFDDIFSFSKAERRGFKWLSVEELSRDGMDDRLSRFPYFQKEEE